VKRTGRDEPIGVIIHTCMETTQRISLYSYPYLKLVKTPCFSYYHFLFFLLQNWRTREWNGFCPEAGVGCGKGEVAQIMYTYVSKCKNDKVK
jgi:hypothetical protein